MNDEIINSGVCWSAGMYLQMASGKRAVFSLFNPVDSGVIIYVDGIEANNVEASSYWTLRQLNSSLSQGANPCNAKFGAGGQGVYKAELTMDQLNVIPGNLHAEFYRLAGRPLILHRSYPLIELVPGKGLAIATHSEGRATCTPDWREIAL